MGATANEPFELPTEELAKFRKVLRLATGDTIAVLPNDGSLITCRLDGRRAVPLEVFYPDTEAKLTVTVAQALPKGDKLDEIIRGCTEIGVAAFVLFHSERTVVRWDEDKLAARVKRLGAIARESAEVSFRVRLPEITVAADLAEVLTLAEDAVVLSESEGVSNRLRAKAGSITIVVGPEGGWSPRELVLIGKRGVTLGPRVLRVDHAAAAASAILLLQTP
ncbi:MAG: RsmE family RNA methyltransferase [Fimbriimonadaceae bacterium]